MDFAESDFYEEIEALQAIFCGDGEFQILSNNISSTVAKTGITFAIEIAINEPPDAFRVRAVFSLHEKYPTEIPEVSISSASFTKATTSILQKETLEYAEKIKGTPMINELMTWIRDRASHYLNSDSSTKEITHTTFEESDICAILHLDHMRSKTKYIKTLQKWAKEKTLGGRVVFLQKLILVLLFGNSSFVKSFITQLRTEVVDVDSKGRGCKERMMSVLCQEPITIETRLEDFHAIELSTKSELRKLFVENKIEHLFDLHVIPLINR